MFQGFSGGIRACMQGSVDSSHAPVFGIGGEGDRLQHIAIGCYSDPVVGGYE